MANTFEIAAAHDGKRIDLVLRLLMPEQSRSYLQRLVADEKVTVNGRPSKSSHRVRTGDKVAVEIPPPVPLDVEPEEIPLEVLFEDDELIVINKPAGMVVHPAAGHFAHTLVNALLHHCRGQLSGIGGVMRPGIVHRLDRGTSGCIVCAKTDRAHKGLAKQFKARHTSKVYRALCWGRFKQSSGKIDVEIGRSLHDRKKMASHRISRGRTALTEYRVLQQFDGSREDAPLPGLDFAEVEATIHTGRTHQIRVHMAHIGHPLVGDTVYGRAPTVRRMNEQLGIKRADFSVARPMLHAYKLGFDHPVTGQRLAFTAPVPDEFVQLTRHTR